MKYVSLVVCAIASIATVAFATAEPQVAAKPSQSDLKKQLAARFEKEATPTVQHKALAALVGEFDEISEVQLGPGDPLKTHSVCRGQSAMGGRFIKVESTSALDEELKGDRLVIYGYDPAAKKYTMWNIETGSLTAVTATGDYDATTKTFTFDGERDQGERGKLPFRWVLKLENGTIAQTILLKFPGAKDYTPVVQVKRTPKTPK